MDAYERSFVEAQEIARRVPEAVLIGGWAVWSFNPRLKSRGIDVLIGRRDLWKLESFLRDRGFVETSGAHLGERGFRSLHGDASIDVDIYVEAIGPFRVDELLPRAVERPLGDARARVLAPTELLALKIVAAHDRRGSEKGAKDLADILALLIAEGRWVDWPRIVDRIGRTTVRGVLRICLADYRTASKLYPLPLGEHRRLKRSLTRKDVL
jgi:hypothetical protein